MRNLYIFIPLIFLVLVGIAACNTQSSVDNKSGRVEFYEFNTNSQLTLEDIKEPFSRQELNLKPQMEGDFPKLNGVESMAYELIDGIVYIHIFENNLELKEAKEQIVQVYEYEKWGLKVYEVNNMLFIYMPVNATDELVTEKNGEIISSIEKMIRSKK